jgi:hypothetical protein
MDRGGHPAGHRPVRGLPHGFATRSARLVTMRAKDGSGWLTSGNRLYLTCAGRLSASYVVAYPPPPSL